MATPRELKVGELDYSWCTDRAALTEFAAKLSEEHVSHYEKARDLREKYEGKKPEDWSPNDLLKHDLVEKQRGPIKTAYEAAKAQLESLPAPPVDRKRSELDAMAPIHRFLICGANDLPRQVGSGSNEIRNTTEATKPLRTLSEAEFKASCTGSDFGRPDGTFFRMDVRAKGEDFTNVNTPQVGPPKTGEIIQPGLPYQRVAYVGKASRMIAEQTVPNGARWSVLNEDDSGVIVDAGTPGRTGANALGQNVAAPEEDFGGLNPIEFQPHSTRARTVFPKEFEQQFGADVVAAERKLRRALGRRIERYVMLGDGANNTAPQGFLNAAEITATGSATQFSMQEVYRFARNSIDDTYREMDEGGKWDMPLAPDRGRLMAFAHRNTITEMQMMHDEQSGWSIFRRGLELGSPDTIDGVPFESHPLMAAATAHADDDKATVTTKQNILLLAYTGALLGVYGRNVEIDRNPYNRMDNGQISWYIWIEFDCGPQLGVTNAMTTRAAGATQYKSQAIQLLQAA